MKNKKSSFKKGKWAYHLKKKTADKHSALADNIARLQKKDLGFKDGEE